MGYSHLLLAVLLCCTANVNTHSVYGTVIHIPSLNQSSTNSLAYYLCEGAGNLTSNTTIVLSHTIVHYIPPGPFCLVENITGLTIYGNSLDNPAVVKCNSTSHDVRGFGFFNVTNLSISNIVVKSCGGVIDQNATKYINISFFYFQPGQRAVFLFNHCFDLMLDRTEIREYKGFAVVCANVMGRSSVTKTVLSSCSPLQYNCTAVGAFMFYVDSELPHINSWHNATTTLTISECNVHGNSCPWCPVIYTYSNPPFPDIPTTAAQGVNVAFSQQSYFVHIYIQQSNFSSHEEYPWLSSGLLLLHVFKDSVMSKVTIDDECIFDDQGLEVRYYFKTDIVNYGSSATVYAIEIKNSVFLNTHMNISLEQQQHLPSRFTKVSLNDVKMINNIIIAQNTHGNLILEMNNMQFISPGEFTGSEIIMVSLANFSISSNLESQSQFKFATITAIDTDVHLSGNLSFTNTGLILYGTSHLILQEPLSAMFVGKPPIGNYSLSVMTG